MLVKHSFWGVGKVTEVFGRVSRVQFEKHGEKVVWTNELQSTSALNEFDQKFLKEVGITW